MTRTIYIVMMGIAAVAILLATGVLGMPGETRPVSDFADVSIGDEMGDKLRTATFGAGCFWCVEAIFQRVDGVLTVVSGYAGGHIPNPTYEQVCADTTGHAEVAQITYDPEKVSYDELLEIFWKTHDPTTVNRQGNDAGSQYRSVIFTHDDGQKTLAERYKKELDASGTFPRPIVTHIEPLEVFYPAENYHQNYFARNQNQSYCAFVIQPKLDKFEKVFKNKLKK